MPGMREPFLSRNPFVVGGLVLMEAAALATIDRYRQNDSRKPEAGGILLGYRRGSHLHVLEATPPLRGDRCLRHHFNRSAMPHQTIAMARWHRSGGTVDYLGEWHTHPEAHPHPSVIDLAAWREIHAARHEPMLFVIAGDTESDWYGIGWRSKLQQVAPIVTPE